MGRNGAEFLFSFFRNPPVLLHIVLHLPHNAPVDKTLSAFDRVRRFFRPV
jgi:hypothetical protein